jgi:ribosomal protein S18 acetylase RimI-like enzyme
MGDNMNFTVRTARTEDFNDIFHLLKQLWPDAEHDKDAMRGVFLRGMESQNHEFFCAEAGDGVIGFCSLYTLYIRNRFWQEGRLGFVGELVVDEAFRRQSIGTALLDAAAGRAREKGCRVIELDSGLAREGAHSFYEKAAFRRRAYLFSRDL